MGVSVVFGILVHHQHVFERLAVVAVLPGLETREQAGIDVDVVQVFDVLAAAVKAREQRPEHLLVFAVENALLDGLRLRVVALFIERLPAGEEFVAGLQRRVHAF